MAGVGHKPSRFGLSVARRGRPDLVAIWGRFLPSSALVVVFVPHHPVPLWMAASEWKVSRMSTSAMNAVTKMAHLRQKSSDAHGGSPRTRND